MPYVHLAAPGSRQLSASRAACWSTMRPATGMALRPNAIVSPTISSQATILGIGSSESPNTSSRSSLHVAESRSSSNDRLAVDASVTKAPQSRCNSQVSVVVTTPSRVKLALIHAILGAEKYGSSTRPVRRATSSADSARAPQMDSARRSCHTIAGPNGLPVARSHANTVSPWLASATAATGTPASLMARRPASITEVHSASGSCSTPPPGRYSGRRGTSAIDTTRPAASTTIALVPDVPWSMANTWVMAGARLLRDRGPRRSNAGRA